MEQMPKKSSFWKTIMLFPYFLFYGIYWTITQSFLWICIGIYRFFKYIIIGFVVVINKLIVEPGRKRRYKKEQKLVEKNKKEEQQVIMEMEKQEQIINGEVPIYSDKKEEISEEEEIKKKIKELRKQNSLFNSIKRIIEKWKDDIRGYKTKDINREVLVIDLDSEDAKRNDKKVVYNYLAKSPDGKLENGFFAAYSKLDVHSFLLSENYEVYSITIASKSKNNSFGKSRKVRTKDLVFFLTQLSTYVKSGIPLVESIKILGKQQKNRSDKLLFRSILYELTMGESFSEALNKQNGAYPKLLINMIKTAEMTGEIAETLDDMAAYYDSIEKTRKQMISALTYPSIILVMAIAMVSFIMMYVIPRFVGIYQETGSELPGITVFIINVSNFLQNYWYLLLLGVIFGILFIRFLYMKVKGFRAVIQWLAMKLPVVGNVIIYNEVTVFSKTLGSLLGHNVFISESIEILGKITSNEIYKDLIRETMANLNSGETVSSAFKDHWAFPVIAYEMLVTGERTGQLPVMMNKVADYYQEQHRIMVNQIKTFIEPIMLALLALIVGFILLAVILPMFGLYDSIA